MSVLLWDMYFLKDILIWLQVMEIVIITQFKNQKLYMRC